MILDVKLNASLDTSLVKTIDPVIFDQIINDGLCFFFRFQFFPCQDAIEFVQDLDRQRNLIKISTNQALNNC